MSLLSLCAFCTNTMIYCMVSTSIGKLVPVECSGSGGAVSIKLGCSGCGLTVDYASSAMCRVRVTYYQSGRPLRSE